MLCQQHTPMFCAWCSVTVHPAGNDPCAMQQGPSTPQISVGPSIEDAAQILQSIAQSLLHSADSYPHELELAADKAQTGRQQLLHHPDSSASATGNGDGSDLTSSEDAYSSNGTSRVMSNGSTSRQASADDDMCTVNGQHFPAEQPGVSDLQIQVRLCHVLPSAGSFLLPCCAALHHSWSVTCAQLSLGVGG